jgi:hypothetical protein
MVRKILSTKKDGKAIPFIGLTNGGTESEEVKC